MSAAGFVDEVSRWCSRCRRWLDEGLFRPNPAMLSGVHSWCRECVSGYAREWREANPEAVEAYNRVRREEYAAERDPLERVCVNVACGRAFTPSRRDAKTCSQRYRERLAYLRRLERRGGGSK